MKRTREWWSCDGQGGQGSNDCSEDVAVPANAPNPGRRALLMGLGMGALTWASRRSALAQMAFTPPAKDHDRDVLVVIFLRGGADALNVITPYGEDHYYSARPTLALAKPSSSKGPANERLLDLDGFFGLNPAMAPLLPYFNEGKLAFIHACGSNDQTRSHFEAMRAMERGVADLSASASSGWISRHLEATSLPGSKPLRAVAFSSVMPDSLRGATNAIALESLTDFRIVIPNDVDTFRQSRLRASLKEMYSFGKDEMSEAGRETMTVLNALNNLDPSKYRPDNGAIYAEKPIANGLKQVAILVKAGVGLEVATLDDTGYDTHFGQGAATGILANNLSDLSSALSAFMTDLGSAMNRVTVVVQSEFGRRIEENFSLGTDHGHGGMMWVMGGGTKGGKVHGRWPGLSQDQRIGPGDLAVTTDYRNVLAEVLRKRLGNAEAGQVFPSLQVDSVGVC